MDDVLAVALIVGKLIVVIAVLFALPIPLTWLELLQRGGGDGHGRNDIS